MNEEEYIKYILVEEKNCFQIENYKYYLEKYSSALFEIRYLNLKKNLTTR